MNSPSSSPFRGEAGLSVHERRRVQVLILIFENVDVLSFSGPYAVFAAADDCEGGHTFQVRTVAESPSSIRALHGLKIAPDLTREHAPRPDVLVIPGGSGTRALLDRPGLHEWIHTRSATAEATLAVGTGIALLTKAGLPGLPEASGGPNVFPEAPLTAPGVMGQGAASFQVAAHPGGKGMILTATGARTAIEASLHVVRLLRGDPLASATARHLDQAWPFGSPA